MSQVQTYPIIFLSLGLDLIIYFFPHLCNSYVGATLVGASAMGGESPMQWDHRNCILPIPQQGRDQSQAS